MITIKGSDFTTYVIVYIVIFISRRKEQPILLKVISYFEMYV